jgi:import inner membrane translocase subunit TIM17
MTDCAIVGIRQEEGAVNQVVAGAVTGGLLAFRSGARVAAKNAVFGGLILGAMVVVERVMMKYNSIRARESQKEIVDQMMREQRRHYAKQYPQLFEGSGDNLVPKVHRIA